MTNETITEFLTALRDGELDGLVGEIEILAHDRRYEIDKRRATDELDLLNVEIDRFGHWDKHDYQKAMVLYNRLMHWKRQHGTDDPRLKPVVQKLLTNCFALDDGAAAEVVK